MATVVGDDGNNTWTVINPSTFTLDGKGGIDTLNLGTSLRSSYTITKAADGSIHVDTLSGASGELHATLLNRAARQMRQKRPGVASGTLGLPLLRLERLTFRFVEAGFVTLSAAVVLGWWFANPWRWDHKAVFSILGWLVFAALVAGRRAFGWRGPPATRWLYVGALLLLLAYVGSRFVAEVLLRGPVSN